MEKFYVISNDGKWATGGLTENSAKTAARLLNAGKLLPGENFYPGATQYPSGAPYSIVYGNFTLTKSYIDQL